jgi:hypothetical protein
MRSKVVSVSRGSLRQLMASQSTANPHFDELAVLGSELSAAAIDSTA